MVDSVIQIGEPFNLFHDIDGNPLEDGYIYVGQSGLDPITNPKTVYTDEALTLPIAQPIRTIGGYPVSAGTPVKLFLPLGYHSISVLNKRGTLIYTNLVESSATISGSFNFSSIQVAADNDLSGFDSINTVSFYDGWASTPPGPKGGGRYYRDGLTGAPSTLYADNSGFYDANGDGFSLSKFQTVTVYMFGAVGDGVSDDRAALANADGFGDVLINGGNLRIGSSITLSNDLQFAGDGIVTIDGGAIITFGGDVTVEFLRRVFFGSGVVVIGRKTIRVFPEWWGAGENIASASAINSMIVATTTNKVQNHYTANNYLINAQIVCPPNLPISCSENSSFVASGGNINGIKITTGNGTFQNWPSLIGFSGNAMLLEGVSIADIKIHTILGVSGSVGVGIRLETRNATHDNALDNKFEVQIMSTLADGFVMFADNNANIMQGNELRCNFSTSCFRAVQYVAPGLTPNWDSNYFEFQAIDPTVALGPNARAIYVNANNVARCTFKCESWFGGFATTASYVEGTFNDLHFTVALAQPITTYNIMKLSGIGNKIYFKAAAGNIDAAIVASTVINNRAAFNGGLPLWKDQEKVQFAPAAAWADNTTLSFYIYHIKTDKFSESFDITPINMPGILVESIADNSATNANEIIIRLRNTSGASIPGGTAGQFYFRMSSQ